MARKKAYELISFLVIFLGLTVSCDGVQEAPCLPRADEPPGFSKKLSEAALERTNHQVRYEPSYMKIPYPGGDVPEDTGVCTDVVIRSYRMLGIDLQKEVHEDITANFDLFPNRRIWGLDRPDPNIDHRRVPNLQVFFERNGERLAVTGNPRDYIPGDLVTWNVLGRPHIGIVVNRIRKGTDRYMIVHNIGQGPVLEDMLFKYPITGHYRYYSTYGKEKTIRNTRKPAGRFRGERVRVTQMKASSCYNFGLY